MNTLYTPWRIGVWHWGKSAFSVYTYHAIIHVIHVCYMESASSLNMEKVGFIHAKTKKYIYGEQKHLQLKTMV
jgi:hypothetical protein